MKGKSKKQQNVYFIHYNQSKTDTGCFPCWQLCCSEIFPKRIGIPLSIFLCLDIFISQRSPFILTFCLLKLHVCHIQSRSTGKHKTKASYQSSNLERVKVLLGYASSELSVTVIRIVTYPLHEWNTESLHLQ